MGYLKGLVYQGLLPQALRGNLTLIPRTTSKKGSRFKVPVPLASIKKSPKNIDVEAWSQRWEGIYAECGRTKLPDVDSDRAVWDFTFSAKTLAPGWLHIGLIIDDQDPGPTSYMVRKHI
jgi:hypothetical protein